MSPSNEFWVGRWLSGQSLTQYNAASSAFSVARSFLICPIENMAFFISLAPSSRDRKVFIGHSQGNHESHSLINRATLSIACRQMLSK